MARGIHSWSKAHPSAGPFGARAGTGSNERGYRGLPEWEPQHECSLDLAASGILPGEEYGGRHDKLDEASLPGQLHIDISFSSWGGAHRECAPSFLLWLLALRLDSFQKLLEKARLWHRAYNFNAVVQHGLGDALHPVALSHIDKLRDFDHIGSDVLVFAGKLVGQTRRTRKVGSG